MKKYIWLVFITLAITSVSVSVNAEIFGLKESIYIEDKDEREKLIKLLNENKFKYELMENGHIWYSVKSKMALKPIFKEYKLIEKKTFTMFVRKEKHINHYKAEFKNNNIKYKIKKEEIGVIFSIDVNDRGMVNKILSTHLGIAVQTK